MSNDAWLEIIKNLVIVGPSWGILAILAFRSPQLVKELFAGLGGLLKIWLAGKAHEKKRIADKA